MIEREHPVTCSIHNLYGECDCELHSSDSCLNCGGTGRLVTCPDDMCRGLGYCVTGSGEIDCPECAKRPGEPVRGRG